EIFRVRTVSNCLDVRDFDYNLRKGKIGLTPRLRLTICNVTAHLRHDVLNNIGRKSVIELSGCFILWRFSRWPFQLEKERPSELQEERKIGGRHVDDEAPHVLAGLLRAFRLLGIKERA